MGRRTIIDAHHHLWDTRRLHYALLDTIPALNRPFAAAAFDRVAACHGVQRSVCVEAASAGANGLAETRWLLEQVASSALVDRLVVWAPIERPECHDYLEQIVAMHSGRIVGVRRSFEFEPADFPRYDQTIAGVTLLAAYDLSFDLVLYERSLPAVLELVRACPGVQFVLDHLGKPAIRERMLHPWQELLAQLAACDNVCCKISGLMNEAGPGWRRDDLRPYIDHAIACFGWDRVLFGSDWPVCTVAGTYEEWLAVVEWAVAQASEEDQ
ncbi:MAG TPA: amidohydrolase family protein, partial [Chloroflexota bacterium]|nr:amidohydrolase family protein [Chloroflexota bacterium]